MIDPGQFRSLVIDKALKDVGLYSRAASELLLGTAIQESNLTYLTQLDGDEDPYDDAMGVFQMERLTYDDIWENYLHYRWELARNILTACRFIAHPDASEMVSNLRYAAIMARLHYRRVPEPLPAEGDIDGQAEYWKAYYNTEGGHGTAAQYVRNWVRVIRDGGA